MHLEMRYLCYYGSRILLIAQINKVFDVFDRLFSREPNEGQKSEGKDTIPQRHEKYRPRESGDSRRVYSPVQGRS